MLKTLTTIVETAAFLAMMFGLYTLFTLFEMLTQ